MKKIFVSMMLAGSLLIGGTAIAQTPDGTTGATAQQKECCQDSNAGKGEKKGKKGDKKMKGEKKNRPAFNPFDGVQLTDDQQQRLQVLQQGLGPVQLTPEQKAKIKENLNLTPEQKAQLKAERKAKKIEAKKNYLNGVKEILTPEQYVIFLENVFINSPEKANGMKGGKGHKDHKGKHGDKGKKGDNGPRGDKAPKVAK